MNESEIFTNLAELFDDIFGIDPKKLSKESSPDTIENWDSLKHVHLIAAIEEKFECSLSAGEQSDMLNVGLIIEILKEKLG